MAKQVNEQVEKLQGEHISWRPPADEEKTTSKAALKVFIMSAFEDDKKLIAKATITDADANAKVPEEVQVPPRPITLSSILKEVRNLK